MVNPVGFDCISWHFFTEPEQPRPVPINFPGLFFTLVSVFLIASEIIKWQPPTVLGPLWSASTAFAENKFAMLSEKAQSKYVWPNLLKFMFSNKAAKINEIFTVHLTLWITVKIWSIFVALLENTNFKWMKFKSRIALDKKNSSFNKKCN